MRIKWLGHASFVLTSDSGTRVLTDPYRSGAFDGAVGYAPISEKVDVITVSHDHEDHYCVDGLPRGFETVSTAGEHKAAGVSITGIKTYHDSHQGKERGRNIIYMIEMDGIRVAHLGDLGHGLEADQIKALGRVDVLLIPVGGHFTIEPKEALQVVRALKPSVVIPMHFKTECLNFPVKPVEDFLSLAGKHERPGSCEIEVKKESLGGQRVVVLEHAL
jgi:L-ascorbate metabolism protein UlaG (beta-lactamase superfamily)